jgi:gp16 family phage-associated protein
VFVHLFKKVKMQISPQALENIRRQFFAHGRTVTDWAKENGFERHLVYSVLSGRSRALRGESHRIAVALGLKEPEATVLFTQSRDDGGEVPTM